jgi:hypothetical protein
MRMRNRKKMADETKKVINALRETGFFKPKKIYDGGKVIIGIIILLGVVGFAFFYDMGKASKAPELELTTPKIQGLPEAERVCVEPREYMKANHMRLLNEWRDQVVRQGKRDYVGFTKKKYTMSLQNTCLECHSNYDEFCNRCHQYSGITPYCWSCHVNKPKEWAAGKFKE